MTRVIPCDGCGEIYGVDELTYVRDYGHEVKYCVGCGEIYQGFVTATQAEEARLQALLDLFTKEIREKVLLFLMPCDLPPVKVDPKGVLRLG